MEKLPLAQILIFGPDSSLQHEYELSRVIIIYNNTKHKYLTLICLLHRIKYTWMIPGINQPKKNTTMAEPFAGSSNMAIANQLTTPPGAYAEGLTKGGVAGFYIIVLTGQEKN
jgi:hypothetical protein